MGARRAPACPLWDAAEALQYRVAGAERVYAFFDYDGTLSEIAATPARARTNPAARGALARLAGISGVRVAVISARPVEALRRRLRLGDIGYVGLDGLEVEAPGLRAVDARVDVSDAERRVALLRRDAEALLAREAVPGAFLEDHRCMLALHVRLAGPIARPLMETFSRLTRAHGLVALRGRQVVEARPRDLSKGRAMSCLLAGFPGALPIYVGDDEADEPAFQALVGRGVTVRVSGSTSDTAARYLLASVPEVARFAHFLADSRRG